MHNGELIHGLSFQLWTPHWEPVLETTVAECLFLLVISATVMPALADTGGFPHPYASYAKNNQRSTIGYTSHLWLLYLFSITGIISSKYHVRIPSFFHTISINRPFRFSYKVTNRQLSRRLIISAVLETLLSSAVTLLLMDPLGTFQLNSCPIKSIHDWYTFLYNPAPNYEEYKYCTQEVVYPLLVCDFSNSYECSSRTFPFLCCTGIPWYLCFIFSEFYPCCSFAPGLWTGSWTILTLLLALYMLACTYIQFWLLFMLFAAVLFVSIEWKVGIRSCFYPSLVDFTSRVWSYHFCSSFDKKRSLRIFGFYW